MVLSINKNSLIYRAISGLVYSNAFIAAEAIAMASVTIIMSGFSMSFIALFIPFSAFFLIYNMDRYLGVEEDEQNMPIRTEFVKKYGLFFFLSSIFAYILGLLLALNQNILTFALTIFPVALSIAYSPLNLKKYLFIGNSIVGIAWGAVPLIIGSFYGQIYSIEVLFLSAFFTITWFRNATIFDIKDIKGDLIEGVKTLPNTYGATNTKFVAILIEVFLIVLWLSLVALGILELKFALLFPYHIYIVAYVQLLDMSRGEFFYSVIIDGECKFLGFIVILTSIVGLI